jgi:hypothetical protein
MATLMRQTRHYAYPNEVAMKQRYQYSKGTLHKSDSHDALRADFPVQNMQQTEDRRQYDGLNQGNILLLNRRQAQEPSTKVGQPMEKYHH